MFNPFDAMREAAFGTVAAVMGYDAEWIPSIGTVEAKTGKVILKNPTDVAKISEREYDPTNWQMEYTEGEFSGLKEAVDNRQNVEVITVAGTSFNIYEITKKYNGQTYMAKLNPVSI